MRANTEHDDEKHSRKGVPKGQVGRAAMAACMATVLVLLCVVAGSAFADGDGQLPNGPDLAGGAEEVDDAAGLVNSEAAEELPHRNLDREGASELVEGVFGPVLESAAGPFDDLQVDHFLADNVAVVAPAQPDVAEEAPSEEKIDSAGPRLLDSTLPLRTENDEGQVREVDLDLEHHEGEIQPANPLVEVGIPNELGEGIKLPELGITIGVGGALDQISPSLIGESVALYPNISEDTDFAVAPTPTGVETLTTIRSSQSPTEQRYTFDLPEGAELHLLKDDGGAEIAQGVESLVQIPPPSAIDANGAPVETTLGYSSGALTVSVEPGETAAYPILVDPLFQTYEWKAKNSTTGINNTPEEEEWRWADDLKMPGNSPGYTEWYLHKQVPAANYPIQVDWRGLYVHGLGELKAGNHFGFMYSVPRYYSDQKTYGTMPESFISRMELSNVVWIADSPGMSPYVTMGLYDPSSGYVSFYKHEGLTGHNVTDMAFTYPFENKADTSVRTAFAGLDSYENLQKARNALFVGSASLQLAEPSGNIPGLTTKGVVPWSNGKTLAPVEFTASDSGLGVYSVTATDEKTGTHSWKAVYGCTGIPGNACPHTWKSTDAGHPGPIYDPSVLPEGEGFLKVTAQDPLGNVSAVAYVLVKIDRTAPTLALTGTITEQGSLGTALPGYGLEIFSTDGTSEKPQSGIAKTVIEVDGKVVNESAPGCTTQNCAVSRQWTLNASQYSSGQHSVTVKATDAVGLSTSKTIQIELQPAPPPSLTLEGTMTEQASIGVSRPRYVLRTKALAEAGSAEGATVPSYSSVFGASGSGNGQLSAPAGSAVDSHGNVWVADKANNRIEEFNAKGEYLTKFGSSGSGNGQFNHPTGIAIDAQANIWVADTGNNRIERFNEKGEFLKAVGTYGSEKGQFSGPEGIAFQPRGYTGTIWVADTNNHRLETFTESGESPQVWASKGELGEPTGIAVGPSSSIWVADWQNNRVSVFNQWGELIRQFGSHGGGNGQFRQPDAIAVDSAGRVWVSDTFNYRVQEFNQSGEYIGQFGTEGSGEKQFSFSAGTGITTDGKGGIWISDPGNSKIKKWFIANYSPDYSRSFGASGSGNGQLSAPAGSAVDSHGNVWVADKANNRIEEFNAKGEYLTQFGSSGSGNGQFNHPTGIAIDAQANIWVADTGNNRIEELSEKGSFVRAFGTYGTGNGQLNGPEGVVATPSSGIWVSDTNNGRLQKFDNEGKFVKVINSSLYPLGEPTGIAAGPGGNVWVADWKNNRITVFNQKTEWVQTFGSHGGGNGQFRQPDAIAVDGAGKVWVSDTFNDRVQEFSESGEYIAQFGTEGSGSGQFSFGSGTGIAADGKGGVWVTDQGNNRAERWSAIPVHSEASIEISADGKQVATQQATCFSDTCPVSSEWTLESSTKTPGTHTIQVKVTDGLGRSTTKTLSVVLQKDETKPTLETTGALATAPEGWVEQQSYNLNAAATDAGYGLTSLIAKIGGKEVASWTGACVEGGCKATISKAIDMSAYSGGSHPAEVVATDGAGNVTKKIWTINVDPDGVVSTKEVEATLEAVESTSPANPIGPSEEEAEYAGTAPGLSMKSGTGGTVVPVGTRVPTVVPGEVTEPMTMEIPQAEATSEPCQVDYLDPDEEAKAYGGKDETGEIKEEEGKAFSEVPAEITPTCKSSEEAEKKEEASEKAGNPAADGMATISLEPTSTAAEAGDTTLVGSTAAATANTETHVDTITRPLYDGVLTFQSIRDEAATQQFQWEVDLDGGLILKLIDSQHAQVYYPGGHPAFTITAEAAHDAIGKAVPTSLSVGPGNVVTLTVNHRGKGYVYPVLAGTGWEGGFTSVEVQGPKDETELREEEERIAQELREAWEEEEEREPGEVEESAVSTLGLHTIAMISTAGPPTPVAESSGPDTGWRQFTFAHKFKFNLCDYGVGSPAVPEPRAALYAWLSSRPTKCREWVGEIKLDAGMAVHGWYRSNQKINQIWIKAGNFHCDKWGRSQPAMVNCVKRPEGPVATPGEIHLLGDYRFPPGNNYSVAAGPFTTPPACVTVRGSIEMLQVHREEPIISSAHVKEKCDWP
jgi:tripartite motif-containing protein 71